MRAPFIESAAIAQPFYRSASIIALIAGPENYLLVLDVTFLKLAPTTFFHDILHGYVIHLWSGVVFEEYRRDVDPIQLSISIGSSSVSAGFILNNI